MKKNKLELVVSNDEETIPLKLAPKGPDDKDWLSPLPSGTEFLCRDKTGRTPRWLVLEYTHCGKIRGSVLLSPTVSLNDPRSWFWVDPKLFCQEWEFRGVLEVPEKQEDGDERQDE